MTTAGAIAIELRKLAEALDKAPKVELPQAVFTLGCGVNKENFIASAQILPHPLKKEYPRNPGEYKFIWMKHKTPALEIRAWAYQSAVCRMVTPAMPARFECEPLLSAEEEAQLT